MWWNAKAGGMSKPNLKKISVCLPEDVTLQRALGALTEEDSGKISPDAKEVYEEMVQNLALPTDEEHQTQKVFEGQLLVLGDSRVGKTSLVKGLTGRRFDHNEKKTHGVEIKIVDRKWRIQQLAELVFGRFNQFSDGKKEESALLPRIFNRFKYRYGGCHCQENPDKEPILWENLFLEKSGISAVIGDSLLAYLLLFWFLMTFLAVPIGRGPSRLLLLTVKLLWDIFQALSIGVGVKHQLFIYSGMFVGGLLAKCCFASVFSVPLFGSIRFFFPRCYIVIFREALDSALDLLILEVVVLISAVLHVAFCYMSRALLSEQSSIYVLIDYVMDIRNSLEGMLLTLLVMNVRFCLFPVANIETITAMVSMGILVFHLVYLNHQKLLWNKIGIVILLVELLLGLGSFLLSSYLLGSVCVLVVMFGLHGYGKWLQVRNFFPGKSFIDVLFKGNYAIYIIVVQKILNNKKKLKAALDEAFASLKLRILDFAGDKEYYVYHHMFMRKEALYIIAFSIRDFVQDNFQHTDKKIQRLWFWLQSVCSHVTPDTPIFLVGTHRGKIKDETLEILNGHLHRNLWSVFSDQLVTCKFKGKHFIYFPVENSAGSNDLHGICKLQSEIIRIAHEKHCKTKLCMEIPHAWIKVQDAIIKIRSSSLNQLCWAIDKLRTQLEEICKIDDLPSILKYFHAKGLVIYVSRHAVLSKWVLLKPELLVKIIVKLVNVLPEERQKRGTRQHWNLLCTGRLSKALLHNILSKVAGTEEEPVRKLLEEYDLICPLSTAAKDIGLGTGIQATHFVPSLLPIAHEPTWYSHPQDQRCYVFFKKFLPEPLFHRLLSRCCKHSQLMTPGEEPLLYRDCGLFWLGPDKPYHIKLLKEEGLIEVTFNRNSDSGPWPSEVLTHIWGIVNSICESNFPFLEFHCGPACPSDKCTGMKTGACHDAQRPFKRRHVFGVLSRPESAKMAFSCLNKNFVAEFRDWMP